MADDKGNLAAAIVEEVQAMPTAKENDKMAGIPDTSHRNLNLILDIPLRVAVELGRTKMVVNDLLNLGQGSVIELSKLAANHGSSCQ